MAPSVLGANEALPREGSRLFPAPTREKGCQLVKVNGKSLKSVYLVANIRSVLPTALSVRLSTILIVGKRRGTGCYICNRMALKGVVG